MSEKSQTSLVWKFFKPCNDGKSVNCVKCLKTLKYSSSTSGMINHIRSRHESEMKEFERGASSMNRFSMQHSDSNLKKADNCLTLALSTSNVPFRFVKNEWFRKFCFMLNPDYNLLSPDSIRRKLHENSDRYMRTVRLEWQTMDKCYLTFDGWDGKYENVSLYAVFIYFIDMNFNKKKIFLGMRHNPGPATAENVGNLITKVLSEHQINFAAVIGGICDAGSNLKAFLDRNSLFHLHCTAHSIALIIKSVSILSSVSQVLQKVNALAAHLSRSKSERNVFRVRSNALKIDGPIPLPFCVTRWGGCAMLATAYLNHYQSISSLQRFQEFLLSSDQKETLEEFVHLMKPYLEAISSAERDENFCSEIIPQYANLYDFVLKQNQRKLIVRVLKEQTLDRFNVYLSNDAALMATYIDPRFAYLDGILLNGSWEEIERLVEQYCGRDDFEWLREMNLIEDSYRWPNQRDDSPASTPPEKRMKAANTSFSQFIESKRQSASNENTKNEMVSYESSIMAGRPSLDSCPIKFWESNRNRFPKLALLARHMLASPQSSAQVERLFSKCGELVSSSRRNRMSAQTMNALLLNSALANLKENPDDEKLWEEMCVESESENTDAALSLWSSSSKSKRSQSTPTHRHEN